MEINIRKISEFFKFYMIRSIMEWEEKNGKTIIPPTEPLDIKFIINNEEMDVVHMFESMEKNMDEYIETKAKELLEDKILDIEIQITDIISECFDNIQSKMLKEIIKENKK